MAEGPTSCRVLGPTLWRKQTCSKLFESLFRSRGGGLVGLSSWVHSHPPSCQGSPKHIAWVCPPVTVSEQLVGRSRTQTRLVCDCRTAAPDRPPLAASRQSGLAVPDRSCLGKWFMVGDWGTPGWSIQLLGRVAVGNSDSSDGTCVFSHVASPETHRCRWRIWPPDLLLSGSELGEAIRGGSGRKILAALFLTGITLVALEDVINLDKSAIMLVARGASRCPAGS